MLTEQRLLGTYVLVMGTETLCPRISQVQTASVPTGLGVSILGFPTEKGFWCSCMYFLARQRLDSAPRKRRQALPVPWTKHAVNGVSIALDRESRAGVGGCPCFLRTPRSLPAAEQLFPALEVLPTSFFLFCFTVGATYDQRDFVPLGLPRSARSWTGVHVLRPQQLTTKLLSALGASQMLLLIPPSKPDDENESGGVALQGILGNKGAVAVRMEVAGTSALCFVCVHMAAHRENVLARNAEYKLISSKAIFADTTGRRVSFLGRRHCLHCLRCLRCLHFLSLLALLALPVLPVLPALPALFLVASTRFSCCCLLLFGDFVVIVR